MFLSGRNVINYLAFNLIYSLQWIQGLGPLIFYGVKETFTVAQYQKPPQLLHHIKINTFVKLQAFWLCFNI